MTTADIQLKGLSREQVSNLLPEGLISLCWRGSVAHGMYVPKNDPDSIDDKDIMGVYIAPLEHCLGFGRTEVYEQKYEVIKKTNFDRYLKQQMKDPASVWLANLDPIAGSEQDRTRPVLVISDSSLNEILPVLIPLPRKIIRRLRSAAQAATKQHAGSVGAECL